MSSIELFGRTIPLYGICFYMGIFLATIAAFLLCKNISFPRWELVYSAIYVLIGALIGAKLLFIIVSWQQIMAYRLSWISIIKGGFVFYGGMLGGAVGLFIYTQIYKEKFRDYVDIYATVLPLGHAIGRIGCFLAGCCYGIPCSFGVIYTETVGQTPLRVRLLPIQLIESACLVVLFVILLFIFFKSNRGGIVARTYCLLYAILRFVLEFFRGDAERGTLFGLSTSQWICIPLALGSIFYFIWRKNRANHFSKNG